MKQQELSIGNARYTINDRVYEVSTRGVVLLTYHNNVNTAVTNRILDSKGYVPAGSVMSGKVVRDALEAQERWTKEQQKNIVAVRDGWTIRKDFSGNYIGGLVAISPYGPKSLAYFERAVPAHPGVRPRKRVLRIRIDNQTMTNSKSVPVGVVLALIEECADLKDSDNIRR